MERPPGIEEEVNGILPSGMGDVCDPRCGDRPQHRCLPKAAVGFLEIRFEQGRELPESLAPNIDEGPKIGHATRGHRPPVREDTRLQLLRDSLVTSHDPGIEHSEEHLHVVTRHAPCLAHRAHAVIEPEAGVPDRVPQAVRCPRCASRVRAVKENEIEVAARNQLHAPVTSDGDEAHVAPAALRITKQGS